MAKAVQAQPEPDYGAKVDQANAEDAIAATAPAPGVPPLETEEETVAVPGSTCPPPRNRPHETTLHGQEPLHAPALGGELPAAEDAGRT